MGLTPQDIDEDYIASARAVAVTGTHLSHPDTRAAVLKALESHVATGCAPRWILTTVRCCGA
jgi:sugar/nucleoside kinase (ribokinase family)